MEYIDSLDIFGTEARMIPCIKNNGVPTSTTEGAVGMLCMDISSASYDLYKCVSASNGNYTWVKIVDVDKAYVDEVIGGIENGSY